MQTRAGGAGRLGDRMLFALCAAAGLLVVLTLCDVVYQLASNSSQAISHFGLGFLVHTQWAPNFQRDYAGAMLFGTVETSLLALVIAGPLGIAIGLYLSMLAPPSIRSIAGPLVEMLAAVPSIVYGFWGLVVLAPFLQHLEPGLHDAWGFIPLFGKPQSIGISVFAAVIVLTVMILPIIAALSRDLFLTVPRELKEGAEALGATRWEVIRGVVLPTTISGVTAALVLGLGRALGEAIAVSFVIGDTDAVKPSLFSTGSTMAERIANQFAGVSGSLNLSALFYAGLVLLVLGLLSSLAARMIMVRFDVARGLAR